MKNVRILDTTLRDGGRVLNCAFKDSEIKDISSKLSSAKIDIVEVGFLRDHRNVEYKGDSTFFTDVDQIIPFLDKSRDTIYTAFIDFGMFDFDTLKPYDGRSVDGIRFGFTKKNYNESRDEILRYAASIKEKGYKLFVQGVNSLNYTDKEILELVDLINEIQPYSFGIVDTYGAMYVDDVDRLFALIDNNMDPDICINFHSHNNYQLSFAFAQEVIKLSRGARQIIIDSTLSGIGKGSGNLNTELIVNYLYRKLHYNYDLDMVLDLIDDYIYKYSLEYNWGYSTPGMLAGIYKSHQNNIIYLTEKFRLGAKDIGKLLSMIDPVKRQRYDYDNIEKLYIEYIADKVDDTEAIEKLKEIVKDKNILLLVPGSSVNDNKEVIDKYALRENTVVISVNYISDYKYSYSFFGNQKRFNKYSDKLEVDRTIISSNIKTEKNVIAINYHDLINRGYKYFENSTIMLLNLLRRIDAKKIYIAGFDGFDSERKNNYTDDSFQDVRHISEFDKLNDELMKMFTEYRETVEGSCEIKFITPSRFDLSNKK